MNLGVDSKFSGEIPQLHKPLGKMKEVVNNRAFQILSNKKNIRT